MHGVGRQPHLLECLGNLFYLLFLSGEKDHLVGFLLREELFDDLDLLCFVTDIGLSLIHILAPNSVQEMADFVALGFDLAFKYRNPAMILTDGVIGQMMEKVKLPDYRPRRTEQQIREECPWATLGKTKERGPNIITSLELDAALMEKNNERFQACLLYTSL